MVQYLITSYLEYYYVYMKWIQEVHMKKSKLDARTRKTDCMSRSGMGTF